MPAQKNRALSVIVLGLWSIVLTALTGLFGAIPMRAFRMAGGTWVFWLFTLASACFFLALRWHFQALAIMAMAAVVGLYSEFEERGHSQGGSAVAAVSMTGIFAAALFAFWTTRRGPSWHGDLVRMVESRWSELGQALSKLDIEVTDVVAQLPALVLIYLSLGLFLSLLFQSRILVALGLHRGSGDRLSSFNLPDFVVWIFLAGLAAGFLGTKGTPVQVVGANALNVLFVAFFFQGLAVLSKGLEILRFGTFMKLLLTVVIVSQLFPLLSVLGLTDYWMDWRSRLDRKSKEAKKSNPF